MKVTNIQVSTQFDASQNKQVDGFRVELQKETGDSFTHVSIFTTEASAFVIGASYSVGATQIVNASNLSVPGTVSGS